MPIFLHITATGCSGRSDIHLIASRKLVHEASDAAHGISGNGAGLLKSSSDGSAFSRKYVLYSARIGGEVQFRPCAGSRPPLASKASKARIVLRLLLGHEIGGSRLFPKTNSSGSYGFESMPVSNWTSYGKSAFARCGSEEPLAARPDLKNRWRRMPTKRSTGRSPNQAPNISHYDTDMAGETKVQPRESTTMYRSVHDFFDH
jgi:hypothetical protein